MFTSKNIPLFLLLILCGNPLQCSDSIPSKADRFLYFLNDPTPFPNTAYAIFFRGSDSVPELITKSNETFLTPGSLLRQNPQEEVIYTILFFNEKSELMPALTTRYKKPKKISHDKQITHIQKKIAIPHADIDKEQWNNIIRNINLPSTIDCFRNYRTLANSALTSPLKSESSSSTDSSSPSSSPLSTNTTISSPSSASTLSSPPTTPPSTASTPPITPESESPHTTVTTTTVYSAPAPDVQPLNNPAPSSPQIARSTPTPSAHRPQQLTHTPTNSLVTTPARHNHSIKTGLGLGSIAVAGIIAARHQNLWTTLHTEYAKFCDNTPTRHAFQQAFSELR